jgi:hypothetical protein
LSKNTGAGRRYKEGSDEDGHDSLHADRRIWEKECLVMVARLDIAAGLPEREPSMKCALQMPSRETLPILKEVFMTLTQGQRPLKTWVVVANITDEFILGLDVLQASNAGVDLKCLVL